MLTIRGRNVNEIFPIGLMYLQTAVKRESRNGPTVEIMTPVSVQYDHPDERVLFSPERDANPFFHLFESLWMLAGRKDVGFLDQYNSQMKQYSDDGEGFNAAYGHRLRKNFGFDQIDFVIKRLKSNPDDRRAVLQIWDPEDLVKESKDYACNLVITPRIRKSRLDWTVFNRSNDYVFGLTGANAVHLSIIQEYVASMVGVKVGVYHQITNCLHAYTENPVYKRVANLPILDTEPYSKKEVSPYPLVTDKENWDLDLAAWIIQPWSNRRYHDPFFEYVAKPMAIAHHAHKEGKEGLNYVGQIEASDWRKACREWLERRESYKHA